MCACADDGAVQQVHDPWGGRACRCRCGAPTCRGTMDNQPERMRDFGHRIEARASRAPAPAKPQGPTPPHTSPSLTRRPLPHVNIVPREPHCSETNLAALRLRRSPRTSATPFRRSNPQSTTSEELLTLAESDIIRHHFGNTIHSYDNIIKRFS